MTPERRVGESELHAYLDGELTPEDRAEMEALLVASPGEAGLVREFRDLNEAIVQRYAGRLDEPVPHSIQQLLARIPERGTARRGLARRLVPLAAGILVAALAGAGGYIARGLTTETRRPESTFVTTAIGAHSVYVPEVRHPVEVRAAEEHLVRWLTKRVGAPVQAPALAELGWKLMGGRLLPDQGQAAAQFMYEDSSGRRLTLYMRKETGLNNTAFRFVESGDFGAFYWIDRPMAYAIAGRLTREDLLSLANAVYAQLEKQ